METIEYEFAITDKRLRRRRLRQAVLAFLSDAKASTSSLHAIGLVVSVPSLSSTPFTPVAVPTRKNATSSTAPANASTVETGVNAHMTQKSKSEAKSTAPASSSSTSASTARVQPGATASRKTQLQRLRHSQRIAAQRACYAITEARLSQARDDARDCQHWLLSIMHTLHQRELAVVVIAALRPRTVQDLAFARLWQYGSEAPRASPLRQADLVSVSFASEKLLVGWSARYDDTEEPMQSQKNKKKKPPRFVLEDLLLPHQSLLLDLTWCAEAGLRRAPSRPAPLLASAARRGGGGGGGASRDNHLTPIARAELFFSYILPTLEFPKGGNRSAGWLNYHVWLPLYTAALQHERDVACDRARGGRSFGHDDNDANGESDSQSRRGVSGGERVHASVSACCAHMRNLYHAFYGHPKAVGHRHAWRLCAGYGGSVASLLDPSNLVLVDEPALTRAKKSKKPISTRRRDRGRSAKPRGVLKSRVLTSAAAAASTRWCAGLLPVRDLRDVYATLAVLVAQDQSDLHSAALAVHRGMCRRAFLAGRLLHGAPPLETILLRSVPLPPRRTSNSAKKASVAAPKATKATKLSALGSSKHGGSARSSKKTRVVDANASSGSASKKAVARATTLSALLSKGRRALIRRRRALRAVESVTSLGTKPGASCTKVGPQKRGRTVPVVGHEKPTPSDPSTHKARRVESGARKGTTAIEKVEATTLEDIGLGWVEDV